MVKSNVLHVWFSIFGLCYFGYNMLRDHHLTMLFPSMCRGLSLVVAIIFDIWFYRSVFVHLLLPLFRNEIIDKRCSVDLFVFRLYSHNGIFVFLADWIDWFLCLFLVYTQNLQCCQSGLKSKERVRVRMKGFTLYSFVRAMLC